MCETRSNINRVSQAIETLANEYIANGTDVISDLQAGITNERIAMPYTVFSSAKYVVVKATSPEQAQARGKVKLDRFFPGQPNNVVGVVQGSPLVPSPVAVTPIDDVVAALPVVVEISDNGNE